MPGRDGIAGLVCLAVSVGLLLLTRELPPPVMVPIGPAFYPRLVLSFMALLSVLLVATDWRAQRRRRAVVTPATAAARRRPNYARVLATFVAFGLYILLLPLLGFRIATVLFVAGLQVVREWPRTWQRWLLVAAVALGTTIVCDVAFERYLSVLLPRGRWTGM